MEVDTKDYVHIYSRANELGLKIPEVPCFLPRNFGDAESVSDLVNECETLTLIKIFRQAGLEFGALEPAGRSIPSAHEKCFDLIIPIIFLSELVIQQDPIIYTTARDVLKAHIGEYFKGIVGPKKVRCSFVIEQSKEKRFAKLDYEGDPACVEDYFATVKELVDGIS
jgi:hypothetical protein